MGSIPGFSMRFSVVYPGFRKSRLNPPVRMGQDMAPQNTQPMQLHESMERFAELMQEDRYDEAADTAMAAYETVKESASVSWERKANYINQAILALRTAYNKEHGLSADIWDHHFHTENASRWRCPSSRIDMKTLALLYITGAELEARHHFILGAIAKFDDAISIFQHHLLSEPTALADEERIEWKDWHQQYAQLLKEKAESLHRNASAVKPAKKMDHTQAKGLAKRLLHRQEEILQKAEAIPVPELLLA